MKKELSIVLCALFAGNISGAIVGHTGKYWTVTENDRSYRVGRESLDGTLRNINKTNLSRFMQKGRISAHKLNDGTYMLRGHVNGVGGGPLVATAFYWGTKCLCWAGIIGTGTAVVASGVGAGVALAGGGGAALTGGALVGGTAKAGIALVAKGAIGSTVAATGAGVVSQGLMATTAGAAVTKLGTAAFISSTAGSTLGVVGTIEAMAMAAAAAGMALPTP